MPGRSHRYLRMAGALALASGSLLSGGVPVAAAANITVGPMLLSKFGLVVQPLSPAQCVATFTVPCYGPDQVQTAYNEQPLFNRGITGKGQTIVIVDSFGSPTIQADLATFDAQYNLGLALLQDHPARREGPGLGTYGRQRGRRLGRGDHPGCGVGAQHGAGREHPAGRDPGRGD